MNANQLDSKGQLLPKTKCPACGYEMDAATCIDKEYARPKPGDISVCIKCGECLEFGEGYTLQIAPVKSVRRLSADQRRVIENTQFVIFLKNFIYETKRTD